MFELLLVAAILLVILALVLVVTLLTWQALAIVGGVLTALGFLFGVSGGLVYHLKLRRELLSLGLLPARWWLFPTAQHALLTREQWSRVRPAFVTGAAGFVVIILGALAVFLSAFK